MLKNTLIWIKVERTNTQKLYSFALKITAKTHNGPKYDVEGTVAYVEAIIQADLHSIEILDVKEAAGICDFIVGGIWISISVNFQKSRNVGIQKKTQN